jgi:hypothetical protein
MFLPQMPRLGRNANNGLFVVESLVDDFDELFEPLDAIKSIPLLDDISSHQLFK